MGAVVSETLGEAYPKEMERCREILESCDVVDRLSPGSGAFLRAVTTDLLRRAEQAQAEGDTVAMLRCFQEMREMKE